MKKQTVALFASFLILISAMVTSCQPTCGQNEYYDTNTGECKLLGNGVTNGLSIGSYYSAYTMGFPVSTYNSDIVYKNNGSGFAARYQQPNQMAGYIDGSRTKITVDVLTPSGYVRIAGMVNRVKWDRLKNKIAAKNLVNPIVTWLNNGDRSKLSVIAGNTVYIFTIAYTPGMARGATGYDQSNGLLTGEFIDCEVTDIVEMPLNQVLQL